MSFAAVFTQNTFRFIYCHIILGLMQFMRIVLRVIHLRMCYPSDLLKGFLHGLLEQIIIPEWHDVAVVDCEYGYAPLSEALNDDLGDFAVCMHQINACTRGELMGYGDVPSFEVR